MTFISNKIGPLHIIQGQLEGILIFCGVLKDKVDSRKPKSVGNLKNSWVQSQVESYQRLKK